MPLSVFSRLKSFPKLTTFPRSSWVIFLVSLIWSEFFSQRLVPGKGQCLTLFLSMEKILSSPGILSLFEPLFHWFAQRLTPRIKGPCHRKLLPCLIFFFHDGQGLTRYLQWTYDSICNYGKLRWTSIKSHIYIWQGRLKYCSKIYLLSKIVIWIFAIIFFNRSVKI